MNRIQTLEPTVEVFRRPRGGWMAVSKETPRIAVIGRNEADARARFEKELTSWRLLLDAEQE